MSTNFYAKGPETPPDGEGLHIGKSSVGWEFLFRCHAGLESTSDWHKYLSQSDMHIYTEEGYEVPLIYFWQMVTKRPMDVGGLHNLMLQWRGKPTHPDCYRDEWGYSFMDCEFC